MSNCGLDIMRSELLVYKYYRNLSMDQPKKETIKYRLIAHIQQLNLNKNLNFQTKVTWKRNVNKTETETVTHRNCCSLFDQRLELELNLVYNHVENRFQPKFTEFSIVVIYQGKIKSGGHVKYDAAEIVNNNYNGQKVSLALAQCPDPNATLEVLFDYEIISESSRSLFNELSMINPANESNLSQINFPEEEHHHSTDIVPIDTGDLRGQKLAQKEAPKQKEIEKINIILDKFQSMTKKLKSSPKSLFSDDQNTTKNESLQISSIPTEHEEKLKLHISELQSELELKCSLIVEYQRKLSEAARKIEEQEIKLELAQQKYSQLKAEKECIRIDQVLFQSERRYRQLYQQAQKELEQIRESASVELNFSKNHNFKKFVEEVHAIEEVPQFHFKANPPENQLSQKVEGLERQSIELQTKIAEMSHSIAQLFNAAYDYGGAKLLDYLQSSIGLTQS